MTWTKLGSEFSNEAAMVDLSDAAFRTHVEAIQFAYDTGAMDCRIPKKTVRRFAGSDEADRGIRELCSQGWWREDGDVYELVHHRDVIRASLAAQGKKLERDKKAAQTYRNRQAKESSVSADVSADVSGDTDRQTDRHLGEQVPTRCEHGNDPRFWDCLQCKRKRTA